MVVVGYFILCLFCVLFVLCIIVSVSLVMINVNLVDIYILLIMFSWWFSYVQVKGEIVVISCLGISRRFVWLVQFFVLNSVSGSVVLIIVISLLIVLQFSINLVVYLVKVVLFNLRRKQSGMVSVVKCVSVSEVIWGLVSIFFSWVLVWLNFYSILMVIGRLKWLINFGRWVEVLLEMKVISVIKIV